ncbi:MAG: cytochrome b/b6 domain-containing protein [Proteobacteria bacterium]|nr:cytochrome b/b6 domain-containing protein [Pseudomonadota bacterium]
MTSQSIVWDKFTRFVHWTIATCVVLNLYIVEEGDPPHEWIGYAAVAFVFIRSIWGIFANGHANFRQWPLTFSELQTFVKNEIQRKPKPYPGHNPAASYTYIAIWSLIAALAISGFMMGLDAFWGEEWLENVHNAFSIILQICILAHLLGIAVDSYHFKRKTWMGMITGTRPPRA